MRCLSSEKCDDGVLDAGWRATFRPASRNPATAPSIEPADDPNVRAPLEGIPDRGGVPGDLHGVGSRLCHAAATPGFTAGGLDGVAAGPAHPDGRGHGP